MKKLILLVIVSLMVALLAITTPAAAGQQHPVGERIRVWTGRSCSLQEPFHIMHGWVQSSEDGAIGVFDLRWRWMVSSAERISRCFRRSATRHLVELWAQLPGRHDRNIPSPATGLRHASMPWTIWATPAHAPLPMRRWRRPPER
jgi:hypothetical protein